MEDLSSTRCIMGAWAIDDWQLRNFTGIPQTRFLVSVIFRNHPLGRKQSLILNGLRCSVTHIQLARFLHYTLPIIIIKLREKWTKSFGNFDREDLDQTPGLPWCLNCNDILNELTLTGLSPVPIHLIVLKLLCCRFSEFLWAAYGTFWNSDKPSQCCYWSQGTCFSLFTWERAGVQSLLIPEKTVGFQHAVSLAPVDRFLLAVSRKQMTFTVGANQQSAFRNAPARSQGDPICPEIALCEYMGH